MAVFVLHGFNPYCIIWNPCGYFPVYPFLNTPNILSQQWHVVPRVIVILALKIHFYIYISLYLKVGGGFLGLLEWGKALETPVCFSSLIYYIIWVMLLIIHSSLKLYSSNQGFFLYPNLFKSLIYVVLFCVFSIWCILFQMGVTKTEHRIQKWTHTIQGEGISLVLYKA